MKIAILLPFKDTYTVDKAGSASIWVKDFIKNSKYKKNITIYGHIKNLDSKKLINKNNYININYNFDFYIGSKNRKYVQIFNSLIKDKSIGLVELHNRPNYINYLDKNYKKILIFHNDPLKLNGSETLKERINIIKKCEKIIFVSNWVKQRFFQGFKTKNNEKCIIIYPSINKLKKFPKKNNLIIFVGKLNKSKGYHLFGEAIKKVLNEFKNWKSVVIGDEPREQYNFKHKNLNLLGWINHNKTLKYYEKSKIAVSPSTWDEPFGRTSMEAGSRGCATIISNRGGITETNLNSIILKKLTADEIYKNIKFLIKNTNITKKIQKNSFNNVLHDLKINTVEIDNIRNNISNNFSFNIINKNKNLKIIHISNFGQRQANRLYNISIAKKISNGLIRNGHDVIDVSDRDVVRLNRGLKNINKGTNYFNSLLLETIDNYKPDGLILGHVNNLDESTLEIIKKKHKNIKLGQWFEDNLSKNGPDPIANNNNFIKYIDYLDHNFVTSDPVNLGLNKHNCSYLPIPVDKNIENLKCYNNRNPIKDLFFTMSHGVNKGILKRNKTDVREPFVKELISKNPDIIFDIYGYKNNQPIWSHDFYDALYKSKMALNLSRINNVKYYSSNRIASLIGNGILTFVDINTKLNDFFSNDEVVFYKNINDLSKKLKYYKENEAYRIKIAKKGKEKYFRIFNNEIIADYICSRLFDRKVKKKISWMK